MRKLYLDVETTGLDKACDSLTVVGAYDGKEVVQLVRGINLSHEELECLVEEAEQIVTFNGKNFDVPFIQHKFPGVILDGIPHKDLMEVGWKNGMRGGLKELERQLGIDRGEELNGMDAIQLWEEYKEAGKLSSLNRLLEYNREDVVNLKKLEYILERKSR
jgi:uncharacterized protein YprB with RNaseH-like and TPR domain